MTAKPAKITVVGSANVDFTPRLPHPPAKGETVSGGKGAKQAIAARRAGGAVSMIGYLGNDTLEKNFLDLFAREGIDTSHILRPDTPGFGGVEQIDAAEATLAASDIIVMQMEIPDAPMQRVLDLASSNGVVTMLNYSPARPSDLRYDGGPNRTGQGGAQILVVNETEASLLTESEVTGVDSAMEAAEALAYSGRHRLIVVTLGANGCVTRVRDGESKHHPAFPVEAVDATAAGDTFCGALAVSLGETMAAHPGGPADPNSKGPLAEAIADEPLAAAIRFAAAAGALAATRQGAIPIPKREEIDAFLQRFR